MHTGHRIQDHTLFLVTQSRSLEHDRILKRILYAGKHNFAANALTREDNARGRSTKCAQLFVALAINAPSDLAPATFAIFVIMYGWYLIQNNFIQ